jgi:hypothetical protein
MRGPSSIQNQCAGVGSSGLYGSGGAPVHAFTLASIAIPSGWPSTLAAAVDAVRLLVVFIG